MNNNEIIDSFLSFLSNNKKVSSNTLSAYRRDLSAFGEYLQLNNKAFDVASDSDISSYKEFLTHCGKSVATVSRCMSSIRTFYKFLIATNKCSVNPAAEIKNDKIEKKYFEILTEDEIDRLLAAPDSSDFKGKRDRAMLELLYATGMKVSELLSLNLTDINLKMHCLNCYGGSSSAAKRVIVLYPKAVKVVEEYINKSRNFFVVDPSVQALFVNVNGDRMTRQGFWKLLKLYADQSGIKKSITPHTLRHSFATHLLENGADINDIKKILGHADISSTLVYSNFIKSKTDSSYVKFNHRAK